MDINNLEFAKILKMRKDIKMEAIKQLIEAIAKDEVYDAVSHFETEEEKNNYMRFVMK